MQNVYYNDPQFLKENSSQYILSIRYATDGLSFCIHNHTNKLLVFFFQPYHLDSQDAVIAKVKKIIVDEEILHLSYKKVYVLPCLREKVMIPAHLFDKKSVADLYRICFQPQKNDILLYRKIKVLESYIVEALPRNFVNFLTSRYPSLCIVDSAYPFIINSLSGILFNTDQLFIDIHDQYFDLLLTRNTEPMLFNSFNYRSVADILYYILNALQQCQVDKNVLQTTISGNLVDDPRLLESFSKYIPNVSVLSYAPLSQMVKTDELNNSCFVHLLNIHRCE